MKKVIALAVLLLLVSLLVSGCASNNRYPTGYAAYGGGYQQQPIQGGGHQQQGNQYGGYVGGGCAVSGPEAGDVVLGTAVAAA